MDARDLRPNNIVLDNLGNYVVIEEIKRDDENIIHEKGEYRLLTRIDKNTTYEDLIQSFKPIELTEEILLKCGGKKINLKGIINFDRFRFMCKKSYGYWYVTDRISGSYITKIEFLHEFQNFIFVTNGQELNINL